MNIKHFAIFESQKKLVKASPLIVVSGTCMNVGKTTVASEIIKHLQGRGLTIFATKLAGVAALRDTENMKDYGAKRAVSFVDAGYPSTVDTQGKAVEVAKGAIQYLSQGNPNYIVIEFGDGLFGEYEVMEILKDKEIQNHIVAHIGCAHDPMGADKLAEVCQEIGIPLDVISGPVTDNSVGIHFVKDHIGVAAYNACNNGEALFHYLSATCLNK